MRAVIVNRPGGPEVLQLVEIEEPDPGPNEVLVEVRATALNRADLSQRRGRYPVPEGVRPDILGLEVAGLVAARGPGVTNVAVGDRVFALLPGGGYAEKVVIPAAMVMPIPDNLSFAEAAAVPEVFFTAYDALFNQVGLKEGETVLIHAVAGGVGTAALQLARQAGATTFGTASSAHKLAKATELGLAVGINYQEEDFLAVVLEGTKGRGVDVILDLVGASYWERNLAALTTWGRLIVIGTPSGTQVNLDLRTLMSKGLRIFGTLLRPRSLAEKVALTEQFKEHVLPLLARGQVKPIIDRVFPIEDVVLAHQYMESNLNFGKIVLTFETS